MTFSDNVASSGWQHTVSWFYAAAIPGAILSTCSFPATIFVVQNIRHLSSNIKAFLSVQSHMFLWCYTTTSTVGSHGKRPAANTPSYASRASPILLRNKQSNLNASIFYPKSRTTKMTVAHDRGISHERRCAGKPRLGRDDGADFYEHRSGKDYSNIHCNRR